MSDASDPGALLAPSPLETWPPAWSPAAVVMDCDGLLVDTEGRWLALQEDYLADHGASLAPEVRRALTSTTSSPPTATHLVPAVAIAVAEVFDDLEEVLVDVVADLRPAGAERTVGPLQALRPVRVRLPHGDNPITDNTITDPVDGPELDVLAHLAPQVASALAGAAASGTIVAPQLLIGDLGLPTDHPARVAIVDDNGHRASSCPSIAREWRGPTISRRPSPTASSQRPRGG